jgi:hypothetical protein
MSTEVEFVVSRYAEQLSWLNGFPYHYLVYNKGEPIDSVRSIARPNFGGNQYDIFYYIYKNYDKLPDYIGFLQGNPFDHCLPDRFWGLIDRRDRFVPIFGDKNYPSGEYSEPNNSWYVEPTARRMGRGCIFHSFDHYAETIFSDYVRQDVLVFPPGSQCIVSREACLRYSRNFWARLMGFIPKDHHNGGVETHIIERSIQLIFEGRFNER